jgi:hypothetical protein
MNKVYIATLKITTRTRRGVRIVKTSRYAGSTHDAAIDKAEEAMMEIAHEVIPATDDDSCFDAMHDWCERCCSISVEELSVD